MSYPDEPFDAWRDEQTCAIGQEQHDAEGEAIAALQRWTLTEDKFCPDCRVRLDFEQPRNHNGLPDSWAYVYCRNCGYQERV